MNYVGQIKIRWYEFSFNIKPDNWLFLLLIKIGGFQNRVPVQTKIIDEKNIEILILDDEWYSIFKFCKRYNKPLIKDASYGLFLSRETSFCCETLLKPTKFLPMKLGVKNATIFNAYFYENSKLILKKIDI